MVVVVIKHVLKTVLMAYVHFLMDHARVMKDISGHNVKERAGPLAKHAMMNQSVPCVLMVDTAHCVP